MHLSVLAQCADRHAPYNHSTRNHMQLGTNTPFTFISSLISLFTGWAGFRLLLFSGGLPSFSISAMFPLWYFCQYLRWGGERRGWEAAAAVYSRQTADVLQLFSGPCDAGDAAEGWRCAAKSAIFCPYPPRSVRQWWAASVQSQRRGWVRGENETGGGASAETLYDALRIRGRLLLLAFPCSAIRAVTST